MKKLLTASTMLVISAIPALALTDGMSKEEIAKLPQDKVASIKAACAQKWGDDFDMRVFCEDKQYKALQFLIERDK